ncbi:MAG TPA: FAD-binding oxidoreductase [Marmoricola sp.]|nr:FAD-binding oxidoreductase [Marmoricola sp.]
MPEHVVLTGWGRTSPTVSRLVAPDASHVAAAVGTAGRRGCIARGLGRSYGDAAQNAGGLVLEPLPETVAVERTGVHPAVRVSAGTSLHTLIRWLLPRGWFVPVTPGTRYVTVGGAIAADVHGKNHHRDGTFSAHVEELTLVAGDGRLRTVGPANDPELFWATAGGMGLTGVITEAVLRVRPVESGYLRVATERLPDLDSVMARMLEADREASYSVAWIDTVARGRHLGRSVLTTGEHAGLDDLPARLRSRPWALPGGPRLPAPDPGPVRLVSRPGVRVFNEAWFRKAPRHRTESLQTSAAFFHPLDGVAGWNRLYGRRGFVQYQLVVPDDAADRLPGLLTRIASSGCPSFLSVLKRFGPAGSGMLSFPLPGWTLAVDLAAGPRLAGLFADLDRIVLEAGGRLYLAKDARMPRWLLEATYPRLEEFRAVRRRVDPRGVFQSDLARRLGLEAIRGAP